MARKKKNPYDIVGDAVGGAGSSASHAGGGKKGGGSSATSTASAGASSVSSGVGVATGTASPISTATSGVSTVSTGTSHAVQPQTAPSPVYSPTSGSTTTVNLKPLMSTITDPATRSLASSAISNGLRYEVNPSVLLAAADVTDYGRAGKGKGYTNLGDGSEDGPASIKQAARYLSEAGFHSNPQKALRSLAEATGADAEKIRKTAAGYTALDDAARKVETADGDTRVNGVGYFKARKPEDRPSAKVRAAARTVGDSMSNAGFTASKEADRSTAGLAGRVGTQTANQVADTAQRLTSNKPSQGQGNVLTQQQQGPKPRKVAKRLTRASNRATPEITGLSDPNQATFAAELAKDTGLSPRVVAAWVRQEGGNLNPGDNNWLNIGAFDSGFDQGIMGNPAFRDPKSAAKITADFLRGKVFGASEGIQAILPNAVGKSDQQQIAAIAGSGWASDPNYASNIAANYQTVNATAGKDVPKQLVQRGYDVLGREATKAILNGGKLVKAPKGGVKETRFSGRYAGSQSVVRYLVGTRVKGDHGGTKNGEAPGVHDPDGDHYNPNGYAQDINGTSPGENEPPYDQSTLDTIVKNLRKAGANPPPDDLQIGENWEGTVGKYSVQVLTNEGGTINHIHVGAHPTDGEGGGGAPSTLIPIKGTGLAVQPPPPASAGGGVSATGTAAASGGAGAPALSGAIEEVSKQRGGRIAAPASMPRSSAASYARGAGSIASSAAEYARRSLMQNSDTGDPLADERFRPRR